jgi:predicted SnoaL-like aldol condensation-catalyzing enzyme
MGKHSVRSVFLGLFLTSLSYAQIPEPGKCSTTPEELAANKQLLLEFFESRGMPREERSEKFQTEDYVQHNPRLLRIDEITGAAGRQSWLQGFQEAERRGIQLVDLGGIRLNNPIILMAECDLVTAIYKGELQDPDDPNRTYEAFAFETVRIRDGKFAEHWDQVTLEAGWMDGADDD